MDIAVGDRITVALNYLKWFEAEAGLPEGMNRPLSADTSLQWFCQPAGEPLLPTLQARYQKITPHDNQLALFPIEDVLVNKILVPLHQAKVAFVLGHELGCIALSGLVGEMLAILRFDISPLGSGEQALTGGQQKRLFGDTFERVQHSRRIGLLELVGLIDSQTANQFRELSSCRNAYLHRLSQPHKMMSKDSMRAYELVVKLAVTITGHRIVGARAVFSSELLAYIERRTPVQQVPAPADH